MSNTQVKSGGAVTEQYGFLPATIKGEYLFSVQAGIPLSDAFDQLTVLLSAAHSSVEDVATAIGAGEEPQSPWAAAHLMSFAYALVQSMHLGHNAHVNGRDVEQAVSLHAEVQP